MKFTNRLLSALFLAVAILGLNLSLTTAAQAQGTQADYQRAQDLGNRFRGLVVNVPGTANWITGTNHFWYSKSVKGGTEFVLVDAEAATKKPAFDHEKLAAAINAASGGKYTALALPFAPPAGGRGGGGGGAAGFGGGGAAGALTFVDQEHAIEFGAAGFMYKCTLTDYTCTKGAAIPQPAAGGRGGRGGTPGDESLTADDDLLASPPEVGGDPVDGLEYLAPPLVQGGGQGGGFGRGQSGCAPRPQAQARRKARAVVVPPAGAALAARRPAEPQVCGSFDGKWDALIENFNVFLRPADSNEPATPLSFDGSEGNYYTLAVGRLVAGLQKACGLSHTPGLSPRGSLHRIVAHRPAAAKALDQCLRANRVTRWISPIRPFSTWPPRRKSRSIKRSSRMRSTSRLRSGGRTAAPSLSSTTSAATRCTA